MFWLDIFVLTGYFYFGRLSNFEFGSDIVAHLDTEFVWIKKYQKKLRFGLDKSQNIIYNA